MKYSEALVGALIGVARATYATVEDPFPAYRLLAELLEALPHLQQEETAIAALHAMKLHLAPDCATCGAPCGRTADFQVSALETAEATVVACKEAVLEGAIALSGSLSIARIEGKPVEEALLFLADALFCIGEDWTLEELMPTVRELNQFLKNYE